jgi:transcriptional regulator with GAF, ATPase, and Fis domain
MEKDEVLPSSEHNPLVGTQQTQKVLRNHKIIYKSEVMKQLMRMVDRVAPSSATVLILGEATVAISLLLPLTAERSERPFLSPNCLAMKEELLPVHIQEKSVWLRLPTAAPYFLMRSGS